MNPMALSEDGLFESMVVKAGFQNVITEKSTYPFDFGNDRGFQLKCGTLLIKDKIEGEQQKKTSSSVQLSLNTHLMS